VLEDVPVALGRHDAEVEAEALVPDHRRLRVPTGDDLGHPRPFAERRDHGRRFCGRRDQVEVANRLTPAADAACLGDGDGGLMSA
jgi:hypothetical protein